MPSLDDGDESFTEPSPRRAAPVEPECQTCVSCGEPIAEVVEARPDHCFVCAVHVVCACADES